ncbi:hypothetical protein BpHYR1_013303 [Brachionus plicatilis]|uniref:Uncharacterized protein n=1 Tax=Brachionus plicatilis TaxID=10195 RepID=A0A3M7R4T1_BRAPC|nr:hypothetical protein BpHYR1_013303 [Brachionus plicatilis]
MIFFLLYLKFINQIKHLIAESYRIRAQEIFDMTGDFEKNSDKKSHKKNSKNLLNQKKVLEQDLNTDKLNSSLIILDLSDDHRKC